MLGITYENAKENQLIRFPHPKNPTNLFFLKDGQEVIIYKPFDQNSIKLKCENMPHYDPYHFKVDGQWLHIDQFAEFMKRNGNTYVPAEPLDDISVFEKKYLDRELCDENGKIKPYYLIWCNNGSFLNSETWYDRQMPESERLSIFLCPDAITRRQACIMDGLHNKKFMSLYVLGKRLEKIEMEPFEKQQVISLAVKIQDKAFEQKPLDTRLQNAIKRSAESQQKSIGFENEINI